MEKSIDDIEFRKLVLKMYDEGYTREEITKKLEMKKHCFDNIITTFYNNELDINTKLNNGPFTEEEDKFILDNIDKHKKILAKELKRAYYKTKDRARYLEKTNKVKKEKIEKDTEINKGKPFKKEEILFIKERYEAGDKVEDIANVLGRNKTSIKNACVNYKIKRPNNHNRKYTDKDVDIVKECIENGLKNKEIMEKMDISEGKLARIIKENNLQRKQTKEKRHIPEDVNIPYGYKYCLICEEIKPLNSFNGLARNKDGKRPWCRECEKKRNKELREKKKNGK